jgi:DNA-binding SARP family transcriptional activator
MPPQLGLRLLGSPQIFLNHEPVTTSRRKAMGLLAYLAVDGKRQTRDSLSALFWPDYDQSKAFANLRHILWEVQQTVGEGWIVADRESITMNPEADVYLDVHKFESLLAKGRAQDEAARRIPLLGEAVKLYHGHFLTGFSLRDAPDFNDWAFAKSEELRHQLTGALLMLSNDYCALGQLHPAILHGRRLITLDPLNESSHRHLMQIYLQAGQHSAALKQYQACEQILRKELGVDPQPETRDLYKKIRRRESKPVEAQMQKQHRLPSHNLPHQLSSFIGREKEQKTIVRLIAKYRLITLLGAGGIGKTRLSIKVGEQLLEDFAEGVWMVELASLHDPALVPQAVSTVFGIEESSPEHDYRKADPVPPGKDRAADP